MEIIATEKPPQVFFFDSVSCSSKRGGRVKGPEAAAQPMRAGKKGAMSGGEGGEHLWST